MRGSSVTVRIRNALAALVGTGFALRDALTDMALPRWSGIAAQRCVGCRFGRNKPYRAPRRHSGVRAIRRAARKARR